MNIYFEVRMLKRINTLKPNNESMTDFVKRAVEYLIVDLERDTPLAQVSDLNVFMSIFPELKTNPKYLKIGESMSFSHMHIDMYTEFTINGKTIRLAVEYNGEQHDPDPKIGFEAYKGITKGKGTYNDWQRYLQRDRFKETLFKSFNEQGYYLISVPYSIKADQRQSFIISEFEKQTNIKLSNIINIDWKNLI